MYEHVRDRLQREGAQSQAAIQAAQARVHAGTLDLEAATTALGDEQSGVDQAATAAGNAQTTLTAAQGTKTARDIDVTVAKAAVDDWAAKEPVDPLPNGNPNPATKPWQARGVVLKRQLDAARSAATAAASAVPPAQAAVDAAVADLSARQQHLGEAHGRVADREQVLTDAEAALAAATLGGQAMLAELAALDSRQARILADPIDRDDLAAAADEEQVDLQRLRRDRQQLRGRRKELTQQRVDVLTAQDATVDALASLIAELGAWTQPGYSQPGQVAAALQPVVDASLAARTLPAGHRTDDLSGAAASLTNAIPSLRAALAQAIGERDPAAAQLQAAIDQVTKLASEAP